MYSGPRMNPHVAQALPPLNAGLGYSSATNIALERVLDDGAPRARYRRRSTEAKTVVHWGQRKLLLSEIEFLTAHAPRDGAPALVVYAGGAPGTHVRLLARLFPWLQFELIDPAPFTVGSALPNVTIRQAFFDDAVAAEFAGRPRGSDPLLFISDVRSVDWELCSAEEMERKCALDMSAQMRWHQLMRPLRSLLKFRLPYAPGRTRYLAGELFLQPWGPPTTTEVRLVPDALPPRLSRGGAPPPPPLPTRMYDHTEHGERMMHFNTCTRVARYASPVLDALARDARGGLDRCYDCVSEAAILRRYLDEVKGSFSAAALPAAVVHLSREVSRECSNGHGRTLLSGNLEPSARKRGMRKRQWVDGAPAYGGAAAAGRGGKRLHGSGGGGSKRQQ